MTLIYEGKIAEYLANPLPRVSMINMPLVFGHSSFRTTDRSIVDINSGKHPFPGQASTAAALNDYPNHPKGQHPQNRVTI